MQLSSLEQQHSKTQETIKEKEKKVEKLQQQLKTTQASLEEEIKKLRSQVTELQEVSNKKVRSIFQVQSNHDDELQTFCAYMNVYVGLTSTGRRRE